MTKIDEILSAGNWTNHDLVEQMPENLNHKMVQKARLGKKPVPRHTQDLLTEALNRLVQPETKFRREDLFSDAEK
jgi:hypothetical protein